MRNRYLSAAILFLIPCLAQGQEAPATGPAKHELKKPASTQTKESKPASAREKDDAANRFAVTVYGPQQMLEIDTTDPPSTVAAKWAGRTWNEKKQNYVHHRVEGLLQMYSRSGRVMWTVPCHSGGYALGFSAGYGRIGGGDLHTGDRNRFKTTENLS